MPLAAPRPLREQNVLFDNSEFRALADNADIFPDFYCDNRYSLYWTIVPCAIPEPTAVIDGLLTSRDTTPLFVLLYP